MSDSESNWPDDFEPAGDPVCVFVGGPLDGLECEWRGTTFSAPEGETYTARPSVDGRWLYMADSVYG